LRLKKGEKARIKIIEMAGINPEAGWGKVGEQFATGKQ
jgi:hypothetical protein